MPSWRKVQLMAVTTQTVRTLAMAGLCQRLPQDTLAQRRRRLSELLLAPDLASHVYGPASEGTEC